MLDRRKAVRDVAKGSERFEVYVTAKALSTGCAKEFGELAFPNPDFIRVQSVKNGVNRADWHRVSEGTESALLRVRALVKARREAMTREFEKLAEIEAGLAAGKLPMRKEARRGK